MPNVLVTDDDRSVVHLIEKAFSDQSDVKVVAANTASDGLAKLKEGNIDVALLDVMLPDLSGLDAYREIRAIDAKLPVILITVGGTSDTAIEAMKLGAF